MVVLVAAVLVGFQVLLELVELEIHQVHIHPKAQAAEMGLLIAIPPVVVVVVLLLLGRRQAGLQPETAALALHHLFLARP